MLDNGRYPASPFHFLRHHPPLLPFPRDFRLTRERIIAAANDANRARARRAFQVTIISGMSRDLICVVRRDAGAAATEQQLPRRAQWRTVELCRWLADNNYCRDSRDATRIYYERKFCVTPSV